MVVTPQFYAAAVVGAAVAPAAVVAAAGAAVVASGAGAGAGVAGTQGRIWNTCPPLGAMGGSTVMFMPIADGAGIEWKVFSCGIW